MKDIHDIRPPVFVGFDPNLINILLIVLCLIALGLLVWFLFRLYKKRVFKKENKNILYLPPPLPADTIALNELAVIADLMETDRRVFYFKLTAILKKYISKKFDIHALEMTSQELIKTIKALDIEHALLDRTSSFLNFSDNIKYAAMPASTKEVEQDLSLIKNFIDTTSKNSEQLLTKEAD